MAGLVNNLFSPLDKSSCAYFLIISVLFFIIFIIMLGGEIWFIVRNFSKLTFRNVTSGVIILFNIFLAYFVNRLLYSMCSKSLA